FLPLIGRVLSGIL
uniref:Temporin-1Ta n=1 Tax=Rana temporaria TaxID=8407 RepID=TPA_RANTE|nr:RecName: Full=Temporin-1Ta; Short=TA; AltName: Full=Temporin-A [Rana temporaria]2MAA_A Chain A, Temporin-A [Rana temporaria]